MFRPQYIEILKSAPKLFFHESTSEQRYRTFEKWVRRDISLRVFRLLVEKTNIRAGFRIWTSHPGRASHPDRAGHPIRSYLGYVWPYIYPMCAIRAYMAIYGPIWDQISPTTALYVYEVPDAAGPGHGDFSSRLQASPFRDK